jgi:heme exporter protein B
MSMRVETRDVASPPAPKRTPPGVVRATILLFRKDLRIELRARDNVVPMVAFVIAVALLLAFSLPSAGNDPGAPVRFVAGEVPLADVLAGFLWVTVLFAGLIGFARTLATETQDGAIDSLLLAPIDRSTIFASKALTNLVYILLVEIILIPMFALLFGIQLGAGWLMFALVCLLTDLGFVAIGTLFATLAAQTRSRELMLPILALPALVPVFIAAVELTSELWSRQDLASVTSSGWFGILIAFDVIFAVVGALAFDYVFD